MLILQVIDLSNNSLERNIPSSIGNSSLLKALDLSHNNLSGVIPELLGQLNQLQSIHLSNNNLTGKLPLSLQNLSSLETLDLGNNRLSGNIPLWIGGGFPQLRILSLRSNAFSGEIPSNLANLSSLQVLDLADNKLTGAIPETLGDFKAMSKEQYVNQYLLYGKYRGLYYGERFVMNIKGGPQKYTKTLSLVTSIDLSINSLNGEFPDQITKLVGLVTLNLSKNQVSGHVPDNISTGILVPMLVFAIKKPWRLSYFGFVDKIVDRALESNGEIEHYFLYPDEGFPDNHLEELDCPFKSTWNGYSDIVGSCDGVFCLVDYGLGYNDRAALWNPSIRKTVSIPRPNVTFTSHGSFVHSLGFGFDSISNDYKLVRVVYLQDCSFDFDEVPPMVEVYTMRRGCWRMITNDLKYVIREQSACAFLNGACHWIGYNSLERDEPRHATVAFNLGDEVFVQMTVPDCLVWDDFIDLLQSLMGCYHWFHVRNGCGKRFLVLSG
ncbi:hypothetical protein H0E87_001531 [Populus deltoides]|uniref:F-box associated beta-propeller type 1 domain-containing protein n=1 Tax=Populus deltoides TaxID=3696 RepID=A0A8T2ZS10_POPDE|nr:hypothetical protein H0E87_001531 [Populus deltoides]